MGRTTYPVEADEGDIIETDDGPRRVVESRTYVTNSTRPGSDTDRVAKQVWTEPV